MTAAVGIKRGRLTEAEKEQIAELAERFPKPHRIAGILNRHPATINWHMLSNGLISRKPQRLARSYQRNGYTVHPWGPDHDERLIALLLEHERTAPSQAAAYRAAAAVLTAEFGIQRNHHTVRVRATILAAAEDAP